MIIFIHEQAQLRVTLTQSRSHVTAFVVITTKSDKNNFLFSGNTVLLYACDDDQTGYA